jgi:hypothetical protein
LAVSKQKKFSIFASVNFLLTKIENMNKGSPSKIMRFGIDSKEFVS